MVKSTKNSFDEKRMDIIGQNGNDGLHYPEPDKRGLSGKITYIKDRNTVDWFKILAELKKAGYSTLRLGRILNIPKSTILGWKNYYAQPKFCDGVRLIQLYLEITKDVSFNLPIEIPAIQRK